MVLIVGGSYQGKLEYAKKKMNFTDNDVFTCTRDEVQVDFEKPVIDNVEELVYACLTHDRDPVKFLAARKSKWIRSVMIIDDISSGLVPMDALDRAAREEVSRTTAYLVQEAVAVIRMFAGIPKRLK